MEAMIHTRNSVTGTAAQTPLIPTRAARIKIAGRRITYPRKMERVKEARAAFVAVRNRINRRLRALKKALVK